MLYRKLSLLLLVAAATGSLFTTAAVLGRQEATPKDDRPAKGGALLDAMKKTLGPQEVPRPGSVPPGPRPSGPSGAGGPSVAVPVRSDSGRVNDPRSLQILAKLEEPISMSFPQETPLEDVLKYIKQATTTATFSGIPIYVDPVGLQEAERSLNSTIQMDLEGVPLRRTLQLILKQLGLVYFVEDGLVYITSQDSEDIMLPSMPDRPPIMYQVRKAERGELTAAEMRDLVEVLKLRHVLIKMYEFDGFFEASPKWAEEMKELLKEIRSLIQTLKAEKEEKERPAMKKAAIRP